MPFRSAHRASPDVLLHDMDSVFPNEEMDTESGHHKDTRKDNCSNGAPKLSFCRDMSLLISQLLATTSCVHNLRLFGTRVGRELKPYASLRATASSRARTWLG